MATRTVQAPWGAIIDVEERFLQVAYEKWLAILGTRTTWCFETLALEVAFHGYWFVENCGGPGLGRRIMVETGLLQFCSGPDGFGPQVEMARLLLAALMARASHRDVREYAAKVGVVLWPDLVPESFVAEYQRRYRSEAILPGQTQTTWIRPERKLVCADTEPGDSD